MCTLSATFKTTFLMVLWLHHSIDWKDSWALYYTHFPKMKHDMFDMSDNCWILKINLLVKFVASEPPAGEGELTNML